MRFGLTKYTELDFLMDRIAEVKFAIAEKRADLAQKAAVFKARKDLDDLETELRTL